MDVLRGDPAIVALARRQHGVVTAVQLGGAGLSDDAIAYRVKQRRLTRLHRGVYLVASLPAPLTPEMAAVLACGGTAVLSHHAAAALWEFRPRNEGVIDVTVVGERVRPRDGLRVHRARHLERTVHHGIPITTPARTLLDLAPLLPQSDFDRALEQAQILRLTTPRALEATIAGADGHLGLKRLRAALARANEPALTRSEAEARLLELIRRADLPPPRANARVNGYEVDFLWPAQRVIVEVDGYAYHSTRQAFERDRLKDARLSAAGYRVLRVTWRQIVHTPEAVIARLAATLSA